MDGIRRNDLDDRIRTRTLRGAFPFAKSAMALILLVGLPSFASGQAWYSGASVGSDGTVYGWGVTNMPGAPPHMYHYNYVSGTLTSPNGREDTAANNAPDYIRIDVSLPFDPNDTGIYSMVSVSSVYCTGAAAWIVWQAASQAQTSNATGSVRLQFQDPRSSTLAFAVPPYCAAANLGLKGCTTGWWWQSEIQGQVSDDASKWIGSQVASYSGSWTIIVNGSPTTVPISGSSNPDNTGTVQVSVDKKHIYWLDAPGLINTGTPQILSFTVVYQVTSRITELIANGSMNWCVKIVATQGANGPVLDTVNSKSGQGAVCSTF